MYLRINHKIIGNCFPYRSSRYACCALKAFCLFIVSWSIFALIPGILYFFLFFGALKVDRAIEESR